MMALNVKIAESVTPFSIPKADTPNCRTPKTDEDGSQSQQTGQFLIEEQMAKSENLTLSTMKKLKSKASAYASDTETIRFLPILDEFSDLSKSPVKMITNKSSMRESMPIYSISSFSAMI